MTEPMRVIDSTIGPVMPIVDIIEYIGYSRSGMEHGREYSYNLGNGHSEPRISWRASVLYACGLKRDLAPDQMALPERAGQR